MKRLTVPEYFRLPESQRPMELVRGLVREPPAPRYGHQSIVTRLTVLLDTHVREHDLGEVCVSPVDVVLDEIEALVIQPDIVFVAKERLHIVRGRIWGAPDLTVEVLSPRTAARDRGTKVDWYARYGVRECWLVDPGRHTIEVHRRSGARLISEPAYTGSAAIRSDVLPAWSVTAADIFD